MDETHFVLPITDAELVNHIAVFVTQPFPPGFGATLHFQWPSQPKWNLLGALTNEKPSAVFKLSGLKNETQLMDSRVGTWALVPPQPQHVVAQVSLRNRYFRVIVKRVFWV